MDAAPSLLDRILRFCLENKLIVGLLVIFATLWGVMNAPFAWEVPGIPRDPVPVDAIPDTGDNQQIVFTEWPGRSPQDVEDQVTYPLTVALLGVPGVREVRSSSMFGFSSIFVIFEEDVEFYWSRSRLLEKLNSLPSGTLPAGVQPALGPDATALGQVFWYTLEGHDEEGHAVGGWDLHELRSIQDWYVRYALAGVEGVSEVASIGGYVREYQIDVDPDAMRAHGITLEQVFSAVRNSNLDVSARTIEINRVEYVVRGLGFLKSVEDLEATTVTTRDGVPITLREIASVNLGPALRRGALDKGGAEAVGGVVVVRYGANPLAVIERVKEQIAKISSGLPERTLDDGTVSKVTVVPFYDRTGLIHETLATLNDALSEEVLVTVIVVLVMVGHLRSAFLISGLLPLAVLMCFIAMKRFGVDANIVALSGIAIAIGTMVDMGIVLTENILKHIRPEDTRKERMEAVFRGTSEVGGAVLTAVLTTVISFLPVFAMEGQEGKLFKPLAFTKTFALIASIVVALTVIPPAAHILLPARGKKRRERREFSPHLLRIVTLALAFLVAVFLAGEWAPLGPEREIGNILFVVVILGGLLLFYWFIMLIYKHLLSWCLRHKLLFLSLPTLLVLIGAAVWMGFDKAFGFVPHLIARVTPYELNEVQGWSPFVRARHLFPGLGKEFMPRLDEGSFLLMPVTMPHASIGEALDLIQEQDRLIRAIPEVEEVVGKIGRAESPLDPAPISMVETVVTYKDEFISDENGRLLRFAWDEEKGEFQRDEQSRLIPDENGRPFRQWRDSIHSPKDIWDEIAAAAAIPGMTTASRLQPIETRRIMLQTGMRATMGVKVYGPDLETIEKVGIEMERILGEVPAVQPGTVTADRVVGKPYLEIEIDREALSRYGLSIARVQDVLEVAVGGKPLTTTVEGRERYPVRVRYQRELRDTIESLSGILVATPTGAQVPLGQLAELRYKPGPQNIKSEDTFLVSYVLFDKRPEVAEVDAVEACKDRLDQAIASGELVLPHGVSYEFAGNYKNQIRAAKKLRVVLPMALLAIFLILYMLFRSVLTTMMVFSAVFVAWSGGFLLLWLYGQDWFMNFDILGTSVRGLFQMHPLNLSVAVWVGFLALFGIATDDGVIIATYMQQTFEREKPSTRDEVRAAVLHAGQRRIRPCLMTTATTTLALLPVLTSTGRGADVMVPMAIPSLGGMTVVLITIFVVPTLYCAWQEWLVSRRDKEQEQ